MDWDYQWRAMRQLYSMFRVEEPTRFTPDFVEGVHDIMFFANPDKLRFRVPPDWLFVNRLQFGLFSVLVHLGAEVTWSELFRRAVESPTREAPQ